MTRKPIQERVGEESPIHRLVIEKEAVEAFAKAVGSSVRDETPPTFMTTLRGGEFELFNELGIPLASILHAEQEYRYDPAQGMPVGCTVEFLSRFKHLAQKRGRGTTLSFLDFETEVFRVDDGSKKSVGSSLTTIVVRGELA